VTESSLPKAGSCLLVIFGGTGDLTRRKLIPALYDLACIGCTNPTFDVLGVGRTQLTDDQFRERMHEGAAKSKDSRNYSEAAWQGFVKRLHYLVGDADQPGFYEALKKKIAEMQANGASPNVLFYVSVPASLAPPIVEGLGQSGLASNSSGWTRIILEKPFGHDLHSAQELNAIVSRVFDEDCVYRIDHYLGKETVQNIIMFRFGNSMFEPIWNRNYIDYIEITAAETLGVESRAAFYEETGALRDMVANHLLQLLTLTAMEPPVAFDADSVREQKVQVLRAIRPMSVEEVAKRTIRGQYGPGKIDGVEFPSMFALASAWPNRSQRLRSTSSARRKRYSHVARKTCITTSSPCAFSPTKAFRSTSAPKRPGSTCAPAAWIWTSPIATPLAPLPLSPMKRCFLTRCAETPRSSPVAMKSRPNGASLPRSSRRGQPFHLHNFPTTLPVAKGLPAPTLSSGMTAIVGVL
jgi:hypothetical protein